MFKDHVEVDRLLLEEEVEDAFAENQVELPGGFQALAVVRDDLVERRGLGLPGSVDLGTWRTDAG